VYTREIKNTPKTILKKGIPQFGTFATPPAELDIKTLKRPFNLMPLPRFITKSRIRGMIEFFFNTSNYIGTIDIFNAGFFSFTETNFWEKTNGKKLSYRCLMPGRRIVPEHLDKGVSFTFRKNRYFRLSWDHFAKKLSFVFHYESDSIRPDVIGAFKSQKNQNWGMITSVNPCPLKNRCSAVHVSTMPISGSLSTSTTAQQKSAIDSVGQGLFLLRWAVYPLRTKDHSLTGFGEWNNKKVTFRLTTTSTDPLDRNIYNENVLFVDGEATLLPPIIITKPKGLMGAWILQDTESMVDITFKPSSDTKRTLSILLLKTEYHTMQGKCEGTLLSKDGEPIPLKNFTVIAKKHSLRL
jgi:hypothetical protein